MTLGTIAMTGGELADKQPEGMQELMMRLGSESLKSAKRWATPFVPIFGLTSAEIEGSNKLAHEAGGQGQSRHRPWTRRQLRRCKTI